jgi:hypothetical protein
MKRALMLVGGAVWLLLGVAVAFVLIQYFNEGAGVSSFGPALSLTSVLFGLIQVVGLFAIDSVCFVLGIGWCAYGLAGSKDEPSSGLG